MKHASKRKSAVLACVSLLVVALVALAACAPQQSGSSASSQMPAASDTPAGLVPNVVSLTYADAEKSIIASGYTLGKVEYKASDTVPAGNVISQDPAALSQPSAEKKVSLVVSSGKAAPKKVSVPDVKGLNQSQAEKKLKDVGLVGLCAGSEESTEVDPGLVFKQSVKAGKKVVEGTKISFTIALAPKTVAVPDLAGKTEKEAENLLLQAGLSFDATNAYSDTVDEGLVMSQSYNPGVQVQVGTTVTVTLSLGPKPATNVTVPDVITFTWSDAEYALESAGLQARYTGDPAGVVVDQDFDGGSVVEAGTMVTVTLSDTNDMVEVPNLIGMSVNSAEIVTDNLGLSLDGVNHGTVIDQVPAAGAMLHRGSTVSVDVDDSDFRDDGVRVPNLIGMSAQSAYDTISNLGLSLDGGSQHGTVVDQTPDAGTMVEPGATVSINVDDSDFRDADDDDDDDDGTVDAQSYDDDGVDDTVDDTPADDDDDRDSNG